MWPILNKSRKRKSIDYLHNGHFYVKQGEFSSIKQFTSNLVNGNKTFCSLLREKLLPFVSEPWADISKNVIGTQMLADSMLKVKETVIKRWFFHHPLL